MRRSALTVPSTLTTPSLLAVLALSGAAIAGCSERPPGIDATPSYSGGAGSGGETTEGACLGIDPGEEARTNPEQSTASTGEDPLEIPESLPLWRLEDFQPQSCGYGATYGADTFAGNVVVLALLQGWCSYCQSQALNLDRMRIDLNTLGHENVVFVAINGTSANNAPDKLSLSSRCAFPLFQDTEALNAWHQHGGKKDDIFIYDAEGNLATSFTDLMEVNFNLSTEEGYDNVKNAALELLAP